MKLHELSPAEGSTKESKRIGRGHGSGQGKTAGKGHKGQKGQSGQRDASRLRGRPDASAEAYSEERLQQHLRQGDRCHQRCSLNVFEDGAVVDNEAIIKAGIAKKACDGIKILGNGQLTKNLTVKVSAYSEAAKQKIEAAGGKAEVI